MADIPRYLPATGNDWQHARPDGRGGMAYTRDNPAWTQQQINEAIAQQQYLNELTQRQSPWFLNPSLVGKGISEQTLGPSWYSMLRHLSNAVIGQPYGMLVPPNQQDFGNAEQSINDARFAHEQALKAAVGRR